MDKIILCLENPVKQLKISWNYKYSEMWPGKTINLQKKLQFIHVNNKFY